jgi:transcriptional regulator with XRE-family HTH domain
LISKIYEFRKRKSWSLETLSRLSNIPLITVWRMERGCSVTLKNAFTMAQLFRVTVYDLWNIAPAGMQAEAFVGRVTSLRRLRRRRKLGLRELARASGVSTSTLSIAENGHTPTLENAAKIAAALGVSVYHIWGPKPLRAKKSQKKIEKAKEAVQKARQIKISRPKLFL